MYSIYIKRDKEHILIKDGQDIKYYFNVDSINDFIKPITEELTEECYNRECSILIESDFFQVILTIYKRNIIVDISSGRIGKLGNSLSYYRIVKKGDPQTFSDLLLWSMNIVTYPDKKDIVDTFFEKLDERVDYRIYIPLDQKLYFDVLFSMLYDINGDIVNVYVIDDGEIMNGFITSVNTNGNIKKTSKYVSKLLGQNLIFNNFDEILQRYGGEKL